ncbi:MAG TPA: transglycosylase SLT domain-containing protein [Pyrinomonadaceae bacterium]|nr:transglycosylase SLT domain-containing protein [Pyrinomonadaceae bacterium]
MKNTSLPRLIAAAALAASFVAPSFSVRAQVPTQSYLRNTPSEIEREDPRVQQIIARSEEHFKLGELNLRDQRREAARAEFDKAVDAVLESGMDVRSNPRLQRYYMELVERVYRHEVPSQALPARQEGVQFVQVAQNGSAPAAPPQVGFSEQKFEPSPLDDLSKIVLTKAEETVSAEQVVQAEEIKNTLDFKFRLHPLVVQYINYYQGRGRGTMETGLRRSGQYMTMARKIFREEGVPEDVVWLGQVESSWRPTAQSWAAASGLWQFIPGTGSRFGLRQTAYVDERNSYEKATRASARYLKFLANRYRGNWELAMAAYNTGEGNIDRAIARAGVADFWTIYPYIAQETRNYVPNILAVILIAKDKAKYGFGGVQPMGALAYDTVSVPSATSLHLIASLTDSNVDYIRSLNPELRRDMTPPGESYYVRVPPKRGAQMVALLKRIPVERRNQLARVVTAAPGEDIQTIAARTGSSVSQLQQWNANVDLSKGGKLVVPAGGGAGRLVQTSLSRPRSNVTINTGLRNVTANANETLAQVAARIGASVDEVVKLNGIGPNTPLARGQQVTVPAPAGSAATPAPTTRRRR